MKPPWIPDAASLFLHYIIRFNWRVFEWGLGNSTRWLARRAREVISVEHNHKWLERFGEVPRNVEVKFVPADSGTIGTDPANPAHYFSNELPSCNFRKYVGVIDTRELFDLIFIDGRARPSCLSHAVLHLKPGGYLVLDNSDREYYLSYKPLVLDQWERYTFFGHGPKIKHKWEATVWRALPLA